jgi:hypothetical protein
MLLAENETTTGREIAVELRWPRLPSAHVESVMIGIPFAPGVLADATALEVHAGSGDLLPSQWTPLEHWPGGTVRWALVDFLFPGRIW